AEDGIRDRNVTGVQTCALPIYYVVRSMPSDGLIYVCGPAGLIQAVQNKVSEVHGNEADLVRFELFSREGFEQPEPQALDADTYEIGRASCRESGELTLDGSG